MALCIFNFYGPLARIPPPRAIMKFGNGEFLTAPAVARPGCAEMAIGAGTNSERADGDLRRGGAAHGMRSFESETRTIPGGRGDISEYIIKRTNAPTKKKRSMRTRALLRRICDLFITSCWAICVIGGECRRLPF